MSNELPTTELPTTGVGRACEWCGEPVRQPRMGRTRRYCKRSHRQRAFEARRIVEMRDAAGGAPALDSSL